MYNGAFASKEQMLHFPKYFQIHDILNAPKGVIRELSGRVLDSRQRGRMLEPHRRHWFVVLEQDTFILA